MKSPLILAVWAVAIGLIIAGLALFFANPNDKAIIAPGTIIDQDIAYNDQKLTQAFEPPSIIVLGNQSSDAQFIHLVLGGSQKDDQRAYRLARAFQRDNDSIALNIIPAYAKDNILYQAFTWALMAPKNSDLQSDYIDSVMSISGTINTQALSVAAQNSGINVNDVDKAQIDLIHQSLDQSVKALPPELPAIWYNNAWLVGDAIHDDAFSNKNTDKIVVTGAYAYATPPNPKVASLFMTLRNIGAKDVVIISAQSKVADVIELHGHFEQDGAMMMRQVDNIPVNAGETVTLKPSGLHLMLYQLPAPLIVGQTFPLTLKTQSGTEISTLVKVTPIGQALTMDDKIE